MFVPQRDIDKKKPYWHGRRSWFRSREDLQVSLWKILSCTFTSLLLHTTLPRKSGCAADGEHRWISLPEMMVVSRMMNREQSLVSNPDPRKKFGKNGPKGQMKLHGKEYWAWNWTTSEFALGPLYLKENPRLGEVPSWPGYCSSWTHSIKSLEKMGGRRKSNTVE